MTPQLQCDCGNQLRVSEHHSGRRVQCPVCGKAHMVTAENVTASPLTLGVATALPATAAVSIRHSGKSRWPLPALVALLLLAAGTATWWLLFRKDAFTKEIDDMALVPSNAQGFVSLRLADLWNTPAMRKALETAGDPAAQMEKETGLRPEEIERLSGVTVDLDDKLGWTVVRTVAPYDLNKVLSCLSDHRVVEYHGESYHLGKGVDENIWALLFVGTKVLVMGNERGVKRCIDFRKEGPVQGQLGPLIGLVDMTRHTAMAGFHPAGGPVKSMKYKDLAEIQLAHATLDVTDKMVLTGSLETASEDAATKIKNAIEKRRMIAQVVLAAAQFAGGEDGKTAKALSELLKQIQFEQKGMELQVRAQSDDGSRFAGALLGLPRLLTR